MKLYGIYDVMAGYNQFVIFPNDDVAERNFKLMMKDVPPQIAECCELHCFGDVTELAPDSILIQVAPELSSEEV